MLSPVEVPLGGDVYKGIGCKLRVTGVPGATHIRLAEPAVARPGDWVIQQTWGAFLEHQVGDPQPYEDPPGILGADKQPFYFAGGSGGSSVSFFGQARASEYEVFEESSRHVQQMRIPLGSGPMRETPFQFWLWSDAPLPTRWDALDRWTHCLDDIGNLYRRQHGLARSPLRPTIEMPMPAEDLLQQWIQGGPPALEDSWFYLYAENQLPIIAALGFGTLICVVWETDADHDPSEYLPGSEGFGSGNAPWQLDVSEVLGGRAALTHLVNRGRQLGVEIVLWTSPGHLSNSSPLLVANPDWAMWTRDGIPETAGYGDVVGMGLQTGYFDHTIASYADLRASIPFGGFHMDSFLTFGILADERLPHPGPQLERTLETMRNLWDMGIRELHIEGCGPFGISSSGYAYEAFLSGTPEGKRLAMDKFLAIEGREYGLYRYRADTFIEPDSYYRALASGGQIYPLFLGIVLDLSQADRARVVQANRDHGLVAAGMQTRHLLGAGDDWLGVAWSQTDCNDQVLFAFDTLTYPLAGPASVDDVTLGVTFLANGSFETKPEHTYMIHARW